MRVRIISQPTEASIDGLSLSELEVGRVYALPVELATVMIVEGWALPIDGDAVPVLPPFRFQVFPTQPVQVVPLAVRRPRRRRFTHRLLVPNVGVAAERKKRKR